VGVSESDVLGDSDGLGLSDGEGAPQTGSGDWVGTSGGTMMPPGVGVGLADGSSHGSVEGVGVGGGSETIGDAGPGPCGTVTASPEW
jgi:hypothetical protein